MFDLLRLSLSGALVGVCLAGIFWPRNTVSEYLMGIIGFGLVYIWKRFFV